MKLNDKEFNYINMVWLFMLFGASFPYSCLVAQTSNTILNPKFFDDIAGYQVMPNGGIRIVTRSNQDNNYGGVRCAVTDIDPYQDLAQLEPSYINLDSGFFNTLIERLFMVPFRNGSTLLSNTQFDCDFWPPGGYLMLDDTGQVAWTTDLREAWNFTDAGRLVFVDSATLRVDPMYGDDYLISELGELMQLQNPVPVFDTTLQTHFGFIANMGDVFVLLTPGFDTIATFTPGTIVEKIQAAGNNRYIITTADRFYLLDADLVVYQLPIDRTDYYAVWRSANSYWALGNYHTSRLDNDFIPKDTLQWPPSVSPVIGISIDTELVVVADYQTERMRGVVLWRGPEDAFDPTLPQDIGLVEVLVGDTVIATPNTEFWLYGYSYFLPSIKARIRNFGSDTVSRFSLHLNMNSFCSMYCPDRQTIWEIDSLVLAPGQEAWVDLGSFLSECYSSAVLNLCLSTLAPNKLADGDTQNDLHCQQVTPLLIDANASIVDTRISVFPNPAHDQITLIYTGNWSKAEIISITGVNVLSVPLDTAPATLDVSNLVPGLYLVLVQRDNGDQQFAKVMIE